MELEGGYTLTQQQADAWQKAYPDEYADYIEGGFFDPESLVLSDIPEWMNDGDPTNGPFDFSLNPSHGNSGW